MKRSVLIFGGIAVSVLILVQLRRLSVMHDDTSRTDLRTVIFALIFVALGLVMSRVLWLRRERVRRNPGEVLPAVMKKTGITQREYEVLQLLARGMSNQEIAEALFISESTVKTHVSKLMDKLDARSRTQVVLKGQALHILP